MTQEMSKLEAIAQSEEQKLLDNEKALEEDAAKFDAFLKENDKISVEAIKKSEAETKAKLEKMQDIKKINAQILAIRSEMSKNEDQLKDLQRYRQFLDRMTPSNVKSDEKTVVSRSNLVKSEEEGLETELLLNADEEVELNAFFQNPQQLLDLYTELEENNLALIQNCQETEEALDDIKGKLTETISRREIETSNLTLQILNIELAIKKEDEKAKALEDWAK